MAKAKTSQSITAKEGDTVRFDNVSFTLGNVIKRWDNHISARINPSEASPLGGPFDLHEWESVRMGSVVLRVKQMIPADKNRGEVEFAIERV